MEQTEVSLSSAYKFSLDIIDFDYIKINDVNKDGRIKPLWDVTNNKPYYAFEIIAEKIQETQSQNNEEIFDETSKETYTCHVCNVSVPEIYINEHYASAKHKICLEITNKAMERARIFLTNQINIPITKPPTNTYFCAPCCLAIHVNDKAKHEETKAHLLCVKHDELLDNFLKIYLCNDVVKVDIENTPSKIDIATDSKAVNDDITLVDNINKTDVNNVGQDNVNKTDVNNVAQDNINKTDMNNVADNINKTNVNNVAQDNINKTNVNNVAQDNINKTNVNNVAQDNINKTNVNNVAQDAEKLEVVQVKTDIIENRNETLETHYHFQKTDNHKEVFCKVCKVRLTFTDEIIKLHVDGKNHRKNYSQILSRLKRINKNFYCETCDVVIKEKCEIEHVLEHMLIKNLKTQQSRVLKKPDQDILYTTHAHIQQNNGKMTCNVCNIGISKEPDGVRLHIESLTHKTNFDLMLDANKLTKRNSVYYCALCGVLLTKNAEIVHMNSETHKRCLNLPAQPSINPTVNHNQIDRRRLLKYDLKSYIDTLNTMKVDNKNFTLSYINGEYIQIIGSNMQVKLHLNNFHGFHEINRHTHCKVCDEPLDCKIEVHVMDEKHMQMVMAPIANLHCVRELTKLDDWKHCLLCNEIIDSVYLHSFLSHKHKIKLQEALTYSQLERNVDNEILSAHQTMFYTKIYCVVCCIDVDVHNYVSHLVGKIHKSKYITNFPELHKPIDPESDDIENLHYHIEKSSKIRLSCCKTCKMHVPTDDLDTHLKGFEHRSNYYSMLIDNRIKSITNGYYCDACEEYLIKFYVADHISTEEHAIRINSTKGTKKFDQTISVTGNMVTCRVCEMILPYIPQEIEGHLRDEDHINAYNTLLIVNKLKKVNKRYACDCYACEICDVILMQNEEMDHIYDPDHKKKIGGNTIHPHMKATDEPKTLLCKVCKVKVPAITANITQHVNSYRHIAVHKALIGVLKMIGDRFYCERCRGFISNKQEIDHVLAAHLNTVEHDNILESYAVVKNVIPASVQQSADVKNVKPASVQQSADVKNVKPANIVHHHMEMRDAELHCRVCKVPVPNNAKCVEMHVNGYNHKKIFNDLIVSNKIVKHDDRYFCEVCRAYSVNGAELSHLFSDKHKMAMSAKPSGSNSAPDTALSAYTCVICDVSVPNNARNIEEHNQGSLHNVNMRKIANNVHETCKLS